MAISRAAWGVTSGVAVAALAALFALAPAGESPAGLRFPTLPDQLPAGEGRTQPCLSELPGEVLCGRFRVYENRETGAGRTLDLAFVVAKALEDRGHRDALTVFRGGPGAPTTPVAVGLATARSALRAERDLLLIDHRGTGHSGALACDVPYPGGVASRFASVLPVDHAEACREVLSGRADLSQYHTPNAMDDLAELTRWLGYAQLDIAAGSYGTREAQVFTRRHPELVRTLVLDGLVPVGSPGYVLQARFLEQALGKLVAECRDQPECQGAYPDLASDLDAVLHAARERPASVMAEGESVRFGIGALSYALRGLLYRDAGSVPARIREAREGDWQPLADYYLERQAWVGAREGVAPAGYHYSALCAEDVRRLTPELVERATAGTFMGDHLIRGYQQVCERWPAAELPDAFFREVASDKPALFLSGERDPVTPPGPAARVAAGWPHSRHVVVPSSGHGQGGPCVGAMVLELVRSGSVEGIDTRCVSRAAPTRFEISGG